MTASDAAEPHKVRTQMIEVLSIPHRLLNKKALKRSRARCVGEAHRRSALMMGHDQSI